MTPKALEKDQELKEKILQNLMLQDFEEIDFSQSVNDIKVIWIHFYKKYKINFSESLIKARLKRIRGQINSKRKLKGLAKLKRPNIISDS